MQSLERGIGFSPVKPPYDIVEEAGQVVVDHARELHTRAVRAAKACGCGQCGREMSHTTGWSAEILNSRVKIATATDTLTPYQIDSLLQAKKNNSTPAGGK